MKLTTAQLAALAGGASMEVVLAMSSEGAPEDASLTEIQTTLTAITAERDTLTAERDSLTTQLATLTGEKTAADEALATANTTLATAQADAETLKTVVATAVTSLSIAVGSKVETSAMSPTELVAKHVELSAAVKDKFKNVPISNVIPAKQETKPLISPTRMSAAKSIPII